MTPKEKALDLLCMFEKVTCPNWEQGNNKYTKQCALIAIEEILQLPCLTDENWLTLPDEYKIGYWKEVIKEINLL